MSSEQAPGPWRVHPATRFADPWPCLAIPGPGLLNEFVHGWIRTFELPPAVNVHGILQLFRQSAHLTGLAAMVNHGRLKSYGCT